MGPYSLATVTATAIDDRFIWAFCFTSLVVGHLPLALVIFSLAIFYHFIFFSLSILAR